MDIGQDEEEELFKITSSITAMIWFANQEKVFEISGSVFMKTLVNFSL